MKKFFKNLFSCKKDFYTKNEIDQKFQEVKDNTYTRSVVDEEINGVIRITRHNAETDKRKLLRFVNKSPNANPVYANVGDSGFDLRAWIQESDNGAKLNKETGKYQITLKSLERTLIHTGIYAEIPDDCEVQVRPRSGLALKQGLSICNTPGTVDTNYVNEIGIIAINLSKKPITIEDGDKIAQAVLMPVYNSYYTALEEVKNIKENEFRNMDGFGSSGVK